MLVLLGGGEGRPPGGLRSVNTTLMSNKNNLPDNLKHIFIIRFIKAFSLPWWLCPVHFCVVRISEIPGPQVTTTEQARHSSAQLTPDGPAVNTPVSGGSASKPLHFYLETSRVGTEIVRVSHQRGQGRGQYRGQYRGQRTEQGQKVKLYNCAISISILQPACLTISVTGSV